MFNLPPLAVAIPTARRMMTGGWLSSLCPAPENEKNYQVSYNLRRWERWVWGLVMYLVTSLPFWGLLVVFGEWAVISPLFLVYKGLGSLLSPLAAITIIGAVAIAEAARRLLRHRQKGDKLQLLQQLLEQGQMISVAYCAESEGWPEKGRLKTALANSIALQTRGIFPWFTLVTAAVTMRLFMWLYHRHLRKTGSRTEALGFVASVYLLRSVVGGVILLTLLVAIAVTHLI